jgi:hypothetical protein
MKKLFFCSLVASTVLVSCCKEGEHPNYHPGNYNSHLVTIEASIASGAEYQLNLQSYAGTNGVATIKTQAVNYTTSEIVNTGTGTSLVYHFSAVTTNKLPLNEKVVIAVTKKNNGGGCNSNNDYTNNDYAGTDYTLITINIKVQ